MYRAETDDAPVPQEGRIPASPSLLPSLTSGGSVLVGIVFLIGALLGWTWLAQNTRSVLEWVDLNSDPQVCAAAINVFSSLVASVLSLTLGRRMVWPIALAFLPQLASALIMYPGLYGLFSPLYEINALTASPAEECALFVLFIGFAPLPLLFSLASSAQALKRLRVAILVVAGICAGDFLLLLDEARRPRYWDGDFVDALLGAQLATPVLAVVAMALLSCFSAIRSGSGSDKAAALPVTRAAVEAPRNTSKRWQILAGALLLAAGVGVLIEHWDWLDRDLVARDFMFWGSLRLIRTTAHVLDWIAIFGLEAAGIWMIVRGSRGLKVVGALTSLFLVENVVYAGLVQVDHPDSQYQIMLITRCLMVACAVLILLITFADTQRRETYRVFLIFCGSLLALEAMRFWFLHGYWGLGTEWVLGRFAPGEPFTASLVFFGLAAVVFAHYVGKQAALQARAAEESSLDRD
ncbi:MAG: hypothetical protein LBR21_02085 [Propionibacteriaceae bacterium]|jgi:hypothetical protein|nr:hypothetical protein [Propionibacteriaceae bacterium]